jgi:histidinol phosphatase-like PHP family hydrolase
MRYKIDHDLHIHSFISSCSHDPEQTSERILRYAEENGFSQICLTDHFWDESVEGASNWYSKQNYAHIAAALPLPKSDRVEFLFGAETEMNKNLVLGISKKRFDDFGFVVIPTTHLHMKLNISEEDGATPEGRAKVWVSRLDGLLDMDLPFGKIGIAHLSATCIAKEREDHLRVLELLPERELERLFAKAATLGVGIELNKSDMSFKDSEADTVLRPFRIAKAQGCKFYLGSDAHHPRNFETFHAVFDRAVTLLDLNESDKFII